VSRRDFFKKNPLEHLADHKTFCNASIKEFNNTTLIYIAVTIIEYLENIPILKYGWHFLSGNRHSIKMTVYDK